jgi:acyl transferase domain-containing protein
LRPLVEGSLVDHLFDGDRDRPWAEPAEFGQPALFSLQIALAGLWRSFGVEPAVVLGHGLGEYAAACAAGVFDVESGLALTAARGKLFDAAERQRLAAVSCDADTLRRLAETEDPGWRIVAENGPRSCVVAGTEAAIETLCRRLAGEGADSTDLGDAAVVPASAGAERERFERVAQRTRYSEPEFAIVSTRAGGDIESGIGDPRSWAEEPGAVTRFWPAVRGLHDAGQRIFVEIGPRLVLSPMARSALGDVEGSWHAVACEGRSDREQVLETAAGLYVQGVDPAWAKLSPSPGRRIPMPTYPFRRERYWPGAACSTPAGNRLRRYRSTWTSAATSASGEAWSACPSPIS